MISCKIYYNKKVRCKVEQWDYNYWYLQVQKRTFFFFWSYTSSFKLIREDYTGILELPEYIRPMIVGYLDTYIPVGTLNLEFEARQLLKEYTHANKTARNTLYAR